MLATRQQLTTNPVAATQPAPTPISMSREEEQAYVKTWDGFKAWASYFGSDDWTTKIKDICDKESNLIAQTKKVRNSLDRLFASHSSIVSMLEQFQNEATQLQDFQEKHSNELDNIKFNDFKILVLKTNTKHVKLKEDFDADKSLYLQLLNDAVEIKYLAEKHIAIYEDLKKIPYTNNKERDELLQKFTVACKKEVCFITMELLPKFLEYGKENITLPAKHAEAAGKMLTAAKKLSEIQMKINNNNASIGFQRNSVVAAPRAAQSPDSKDPVARASSGRISPPTSPGSSLVYK